MILMFGYSQEKETGNVELINFRTFFKDKSPEEIMKVLREKHRNEFSEGNDNISARKKVETIQCDVQTTHAWLYNITNIPGDTSEIVKSRREGRVGIGVCSPEAKVHIRKVQLDDRASHVFLVENEVEKSYVGGPPPTPYTFFSVTDAGDVGIYTKHPQATLDIAKKNASMYLGNKNSQHFWLRVFDDPKFPFNILNSSQPLLFNFTGAPVYFGLWNNARVLVSGVLGVGTITPQARLHVNNGEIRVGTGNYVSLGKNYLNSVGTSLYINRNTGRYVYFGSENARLRVGINTLSPDAEFQVNGYGKFGSKTNYISIGYNGANASIEYTGSSGVLFLNYYGGKRVVVGNELVVNGKLGIGTGIDPQYVLNACGKIHATELKVEPQTWCDYVFEEDYPLKPWKEVVQYYKTHKHLPGVPSQEEVEKEGIYVAEMNRILLEKVEELYRYIEQLEQRVRELEKK